MKRLLGYFLGSLVMLCILAFTPRIPADEDSWINFRFGDIRSAIVDAKTEDKLIFVDVYAHWCMPCKLMDESTFKSDEVIRLINTHYVPVKINVETDEGRLFSAQEGVQTLPALIILNEKGERLAKMDKALKADQMIGWLNKYIYEKS